MKRNKFLELFKLINHNNFRFQSPLILRIYGLLNELNLRNENRYILCNFIDQYSDLFKLQKDIYLSNQDCSLDQLFLYAFNKARSHNVLNALYNEYKHSIIAIYNKVDTRAYSP
ncbi:MAG: hypothetical protein ACFE85_01170 [Candidatus Hodarchaeota archaeon]